MSTPYDANAPYVPPSRLTCARCPAHLNVPVDPARAAEFARVSGWHDRVQLSERGPVTLPGGEVILADRPPRVVQVPWCCSALHAREVASHKLRAEHDDQATDRSVDGGSDAGRAQLAGPAGRQLPPPWIRRHEPTERTYRCSCGATISVGGVRSDFDSLAVTLDAHGWVTTGAGPVCGTACARAAAHAGALPPPVAVSVIADVSYQKRLAESRAGQVAQKSTKVAR
jgi:hypothetical protein